MSIVWALHSVSPDMAHTEVAKRVTKVGGGHPSPMAICLLRKKFDDDPGWHPGKSEEVRKRPGPKPMFTAQKKQAVANAAMAMDKRGEAVSVEQVQARTPKASLNPKTGAPFTAKYILQVFRGMCHDGDPDDTWDRHTPYAKTALLPELLPLRYSWAGKVLRMHRNSGWYYRNCIWFDPCHTLVPKGPRAVFNQGQAARGRRKVWSSKGKLFENKRLLGSKHGGKQLNSGDKRVWWFVVLTRGVVRLKVMDGKWEQTGAGMAEFVSGLNDLLVDMLGADAAKPRVCFTDRGPGFYNSLNGEIVQKYHGALKKHGFRPFAGVEGDWQPADLADFFPHETIVAWVREWFRKRPFKVVEDVEVNHRLFLDRLRECEAYVNTRNTEGVCRGVVKRLRELRAGKGARLRR